MQNDGRRLFRMNNWTGWILCLSIGFVMGTALFRPHSPFYGIVEKDIPLDTLAGPFPSAGIVKKGTVVMTGNIAKGGNAPFEISGWVPKDRIRLLGDHENVQTFLSGNSSREKPAHGE